jgi:Gram-negative bacterial TonB protein C-terminal
MVYRVAGFCALAVLLLSVGSPKAQQQAKTVPLTDVLRELVKRSTLAEPGGKPFYLRAKVVDTKQADWEYNSEVEEYWLSPTKWRRTVRSKGFSQTLIVDGEQRFEQNTGDYFPPAVERQIESLVDPIPVNVFQAFEKLSMEIQEPDGKPGQCFADQYFDDQHGERVRAAVALDSRTGLLNYLWFPGWSVGVFTDYRSFHHKLVAWKTKDNAVNAEVEALKDLEHPDESLFAIKDATPTSVQIRTVLVSGTEYKKQLSNAAELKWPAVSGPPNSGTVNVAIVTDRDGHVREARSYLASNSELKDWIVDQVKGWKFKPYLVDGAAVQVETTFDIEFKTELKSGAPNLPAASSYFDRAHQLSGLRAKGAQPFHLRASFEAFGSAEFTGVGTYEETWVSPTKWRVEAVLGGHTVKEARNGDLGFRKFDQPYSARRVDQAMEVLSADLPGGSSTSGGPSWRVANGQLGKAEMVQVWRGNIGDDGKPGANTPVYYFSPDNGLLRGHHEMSDLTIYNDFADFSGKMIARRLSVSENGFGILEIKIEQLGASQPQTDDFFTLAGVSPISYATDNIGDKHVPAVPIKQVKPAYTADLRAQGFHGKFACNLLIDSHGHVRDVTCPAGLNPVVEAAVRVAGLQWEYAPATFNGRPSMSIGSVEFQF